MEKGRCSTELTYRLYKIHELKTLQSRLFFLLRSWSELWNLTVLMRSRHQSTPPQLMTCTFMTGSTRKPLPRRHPGNLNCAFVCVKIAEHKCLTTVIAVSNGILSFSHIDVNQ